MDPRDRGLAYGDGVFETLRVTAAGQVPLWPLHRQRLQAGCAALGIPLELSRLEQALADQLSASAGQGGVLKLIVTRGVGGRGYLPPASPVPNWFWQHGALPVWADSLRREGLTLGLCSTPLYPEPLAGFKHLNRLPQVQARREVARQGWHEGLLLSAHRQPLEATAMNLFARIDGHWWTPDLAAAGAGVGGVMRQWLLQHLAGQVRCDLRPLSQLRTAEAVFLCNSVVGVLPVRKLAQWHWPVSESVRQLQQTVDTLF
ncbi:4-amino-4-deoxychorismate lyase [Alcanivorax hongdengensis A-11-3]|uniref:Aminodeoxychorismate lyase n=1 Tax=Alcanivorax hongdengensis A-11-3 TaxID=1177179 RepID=L0WGB9_9GAMM|nr:aminodeoxychorismate lyase [Alcanivorax hongdengensis]EKF75202.1 4-amino-4-deoxychorismate lyase [Alcanivorax hongdengensis A-11-3]